ncbi:GGDEF domain-containing protein [Rhodoferax sp. OV413]|uniref:GGDEF domain-containing protein n=1 Tax=Rhodoferax sp. OV413 TaxID=1855285 RepID=UPI000B868CDB|nr:GGDEF domain-containing protein [Rhodoferax sp. OV413]
MTAKNQTPILQHLVDITGHRDHSRLELSVVSALRQLMDIRRVRKLEFSTHNGETSVRPMLLLDEGQVLAESEHAGPEHGEPLSAYPELLDCIEENTNSTQRIADDGVVTLWLPVRLDQKVVSCIEITNDKAYSAQTIEVIHGIIEVYRNYQSLLDYSERDALTGLFNRKTFDEQFARYARGSTPPGERRGADTQWLAVVDIDHFKQVNDRFGHVYGDEVLILVANLLRSSFRANDRIFRFGGEEFVVLLRSADLDSARSIFERFRQNIEEYDFPQVGRVTVSVGFTGTSQGAPVEILGHADQALYYAKQHGRNQVCFYEELMSSGALQVADVAHNDVELF